MAQRLRIFVSSPGDVPEERLRAGLVIDKLAQEFRRYFSFEVIRWEHEALIASGHFQDALDPPSKADIVVLILWSRLGTHLPEKTTVREYRGIDGRAPVTGTEWEYEDALKAARERGAPDLLAFRNTSPAPISPHDPEARANSIAQLDALDAFWRRHFADRGVFLAAYDAYTTLEQFTARLEESLRKLIERRIKALPDGDAPVATWFAPPFRGLQAYGLEHAPIYFGRDEAVAQAAEQLAANARAGTAFLLVCGPSGSGKSSLVQAAVMPRLMHPQRIEGVAFTRRLVFRPGGGDPLLGLAEALTRTPIAEGVGLPELLAPGQAATELARHLREGADKPGFVFANALGRLTEMARANGQLLAFESAKMMLIVDQLEELFTATSVSADDRRVFLRLMAGLARSGSVWVIATLRADFWHRAAAVPEFLELSQGAGRLDLAAPAPAELAEMIRKPAQAAGLSFETHEQSGLGLDVVIAADAMAAHGSRGFADAAPGVLPLLSFVLDALYAEDVTKGGSNKLTFASYAALGKLQGAMSKRAEEIVGALLDTAQAAVPRVLRMLVTIASGNEQSVVARTILLARFGESTPARTVIDAFTAERLVVAAEADDATPTVRLAHEALITHWERARQQFAADRRDLETRTFVEQQEARWEKAGGRDRRRLLLRDPDLANALDLARRWGEELDERTRVFIASSRQRARLLQRLIAAAAVLFAVVALTASALGLLAYQSSRRAEAAAREANVQRDQVRLVSSRALATAADARINSGDVTSGTLLALEAADQRMTPELEAALINGRLHLRELAVLPAARRRVNTAAFSSDGGLIVTASSDEAEIWRARDGAPVGTLVGHSDKINKAAFSSDGAYVATASDDMTVRVWDVRTQKTVVVLSGHGGPVTALAFDGDGTRLVTGSADKTARIWDLKSGQSTAVLSGHTGPISSVSFSPDGKRVLTTAENDAGIVWDAQSGSVIARNVGDRDGAFSSDGAFVVSAAQDGRAVVWESATGRTFKVLKGHSDVIFTAQFIPGGGLKVITASRDHTARIWDGLAGTPLAVLRHDAIVMTARPSANGRYIVTSSYDRTARLWDVDTGGLRAVLAGHSSWIHDALPSADAARIITLGEDRTARLWGDTTTAIASGRVPARTFIRFRAAISPDGHFVAAPSRGAAAQVWDARSGNVVAVLRGHANTVNSVAFDHAGRRVVTASSDKTARVWDAETGRLLATFSGHDGGVTWVAFSPDDRRIVTASVDRTARIWNAETGQQLAVLRGHVGELATAAFSPDGELIMTVSSGDHTVRLWNARTGQPSGPGILTRGGDVWSAAFSPDGKRIVVSGLLVSIRDAATGNEIATGSKFGERVVDATYTPDGRYLLLASLDGKAHILNADDLTPVATLTDFSGPMFAISITADSRSVLTTSGTDSLRVWPMGLGSGLVSDLKAAIPRCLTPDERAEFKLTPDPPEWCFAAGKWPQRSRAWQIWHRHRNDPDKAPLPGTADWVLWVGKTGSSLIDRDPAEAVEMLEEGASLWRELYESNRDDVKIRRYFVVQLIELARALKAVGKTTEAIATYRELLPILDAVVRAEPQNEAVRDAAADVYERLADALVAADNRADAIGYYRDALGIRLLLANAAADNASRQGALADIDEKLAVQLQAGGNKVEALQVARDGVAILQKLATAEAGNDGRQQNLAYALRVLADALLAAGNVPEAMVTYQQLLTIRQKLAAAQPDNIERRKDLAAAHRYLAVAIDADGRRGDAISEYRNAAAILEQVVVRAERDEVASNGAPGAKTAAILGNLSWYALLAADFDKALAASRRAVQLAPDQIWLQTNLAHALMFLNKTDEARAIFLRYRGRIAQGQQTWEKTVLEDFAAFRKVGLINPLMGEIEKEFSAKS